MLKRKLVRALVIWTGEWNRELHEAIEAKVFEEYRHSFPAGAKDAPETIEKMRTFYYNRMTNKANTLIGLVAILRAA